MNRLLFIILFSILSCAAKAQSGDSLFVVRKGSSWVIRYTVKPGETIHMLALRFFITENTLKYANDAEAIKAFGSGAIINIPVTAENYFVQKQTFGEQKELYYRVGPKDDISTVSTYAGVARQQIRMWNSLKGNSLHPDEVLFVGWVKYMYRDTSNPATELAYPAMHRKVVAVADTGKIRVLGGLDTVYNRQTNNGSNVISEKGTVVFYEQTGKARVYYAFHNATPKGTVIKVTNPGTGKSTYVKVVGPLPDTKQYANSIIGISSAAKEALGVTQSKAWCELSYSPN